MAGRCAAECMSAPLVHSLVRKLAIMRNNEPISAGGCSRVRGGIRSGPRFEDTSAFYGSNVARFNGIARPPQSARTEPHQYLAGTSFGETRRMAAEHAVRELTCGG